MGREVAQGLHYLHNEGIIHRDLKSPNVLLTKERTVKVCDFGLAKVKSTSVVTSSATAAAAGSSGGGKIVGTYAWMAPETLDFPAIMGFTLVVGVIYAVLNLVIDLCYLLLDPRLREEQRS